MRLVKAYAPPILTNGRNKFELIQGVTKYWIFKFISILHHILIYKLECMHYSTVISEVGHMSIKDKIHYQIGLYWGWREYVMCGSMSLSNIGLASDLLLGTSLM